VALRCVPFGPTAGPTGHGRRAARRPASRSTPTATTTTTPPRRREGPRPTGSSATSPTTPPDPPARPATAATCASSDQRAPTPGADHPRHGRAPRGGAGFRHEIREERPQGEVEVGVGAAVGVQPVGIEEPRLDPGGQRRGGVELGQAQVRAPGRILATCGGRQPDSASRSDDPLTWPLGPGREMLTGAVRSVRASVSTNTASRSRAPPVSFVMPLRQRERAMLSHAARSCRRKHASSPPRSCLQRAEFAHCRSLRLRRTRGGRANARPILVRGSRDTPSGYSSRRRLPGSSRLLLMGK
jgi:hypothetical protein